ncbi:bifunctional DNA-formamidopyrimidine glycosylase/DNA-(apurinic or apyrimidinic site) lyase [Pseudoroseomonas cervicalis]|uniref:bifunctional DNA-formamidopyrimidine glycosylase/DNA-(apurinic or apyrimidinic site) lyase n=1 Tax=Teichococcus cervicalis TaxID=204525 RepID=UPI0022F16F49|nr:bifunctional DNA-formamidopyrimidine glycosylase/DNA-(apurinic or apyrimidinic site) lyase [Pseudoroseomonas cervicalis]WBV42979.1 bifunctional DNA-formamidopyrimidine glycosylase/DNA-(apurinic or apyrimidinic site) lyase [Pseudoroseomonas cervicalis]
MPELPEVETVMRGLSRLLLGRTLTLAATNREGMRWPFPAGLAARLTGARVESFRRRGKYMLMRLSGGDSVLIHLGMSGRMVARPVGSNLPPPPHEHLVMQTDEGQRVGFADPRRFGSVDLVPTAAEDGHKLLAGMGPEPLEEGFTPGILASALTGKKTPIKAALLDQRVVAGLGNIYVAEALFRSGISPRRLAHTIPGARAEKLVPAIKAVLEEAIEAGGSSLRDYVQADGELGHFQDRFHVYDREGAPCPLCPGPPTCRGVSRIVQSGRSTFYCARTQR